MANAFAHWIKRNGLTRHAVAVALGLGDSAISKVCKPGHWPTLEVARRIYLFTGAEVTPDDMFASYTKPEEARNSAEHQLARQAIAEAAQRREAAEEARRLRRLERMRQWQGEKAQTQNSGPSKATI